MSRVPKLRFPEFSGEWEEKKLGDVLDYIQPTKYLVTDTEYDNSYNTPVLTAGKTFILGYTNETDGIFENNLPVIIFDDFTTANKFVDFPFKAKSSAMKILTPKNTNNIKFIYEAMQMIKYEVGGHERHWISKFTFLNILMPCLQEQTKIADFLSAVDTKIEQLTKKEKLLQQYKKGVMQKIFSQEIRFKADDGSEFPEWEEKKLGEVAKFRRGSFPQPYGLPEWYDDENGMPFIQVYDVDDNMKLKPKTKNKISKLAQPSSVFVEKGSIILTIQGSIGRIALTQYDAFVDRTLLIFTDYRKPINKVFFIYLIFLLFEIEKMKAPGGTIKTITKEALTEFKIQLPCLEEQTKIANFLSSIDSKIEQVQKQLDSTKEFKKGLLQQMFV